MRAPRLELRLAGRVGCIEKMQLMPRAGLVDDVLEPCALIARVARKVDHYRHTARQQIDEVRPKHYVDAAGVFEIRRNIDDGVRIERVEPLVLNEQNRVVAGRELFGERRLPCRHLPAQEEQLPFHENLRSRSANGIAPAVPDRKSTRLNSRHRTSPRTPSS